MAAVRRRQYIVSSKFQLKFAGMIVLFMFCIAFFSAIIVYYNIWMLLGEKLANVYPQGRLVGILKSANTALFWRIALLTPFVFMLAILLSHRIAGPIYRMKKDLDEVLAGNYSKRLKLRKTDELKDVADSVNMLIERLEGAQKKTKV